MTDDLISRRSTILAGAALPLGAATHLHAQAQPAPQSPNPRPRTHDLLGKPAPAINLNKVGGGQFASRDLRGKTTIVQFWGLWCPDCLRDTDDVAVLASRVTRERRLRFMSVHTRGRYGRWGNLDTFFAEKGYRYPVAIDDDQAAYRAWAIKWVPSFLIVNRQGIMADYTTDLTAGGGIGIDGLLNKALAVARA
jgi:thiol-disulfide isomerase/thioredoxin